jgi:hypothetical protein
VCWRCFAQRPETSLDPILQNRRALGGIKFVEPAVAVEPTPAGARAIPGNDIRLGVGQKFGGDRHRLLVILSDSGEIQADGAEIQAGDAKAREKNTALSGRSRWTSPTQCARVRRYSPFR